MGYTKLYSGLVFSTVWREDMHVKIVWITLLALSDWNGIVGASVPGLASAAGVSIDQCLEALERLSSPDEHSRTKEYGGRRIEAVDGGWFILNYAKYREMRDEERRKEQVRQAVARYREKKKADVSNGHQSKPRKAHTTTSTSTEAVRTTDLLPTYSSSVGRKSVQAPADPLVGGVTPDHPAHGEQGERPRAVAAPDPLFLRAHDAEKAIRVSTDALRTKLYGLVSQMVEEDPEHGDPTELMRLVTAYDRPDGKRVPGVVNAATLSHERLENSIADAEALLAEWRQAHGAK